MCRELQNLIILYFVVKNKLFMFLSLFKYASLICQLRGGDKMWKICIAHVQKAFWLFIVLFDVEFLPLFLNLQVLESRAVITLEEALSVWMNLGQIFVVRLVFRQFKPEYKFIPIYTLQTIQRMPRSTR